MGARPHYSDVTVTQADGTVTVAPASSKKPRVRKPNRRCKDCGQWAPEHLFRTKANILVPFCRRCRRTHSANPLTGGARPGPSADT